MQTFVLPISTDLLWFDRAGYGLLPQVESSLYGKDYFAEYQKRDATEMGEKLTRARIDFVDRHRVEWVCDIGIGGGRFVKDRNAAWGHRMMTAGFDVNPEAIQWLKDENLWFDPILNGSGMAFTFWDSFEHIPDPSQLLSQTNRVFMSIPIFRDRDHALQSKHYKPGEHIYYFTHAGLVRFMRNYGFELVEANTMETDLGREEIESFYFRRK